MKKGKMGKNAAGHRARLLTSRCFAILTAVVWTLAPVANASHLKFRLSSHPETLDWTLAHTSKETYFLVNMMEGLVGLEGSKPVPQLAESWDISDQGKKIEFKLRKGIVWSDGKPLTAQNVIDAWERLINPATKSRSAYLFKDVASFKAAGNDRLLVRLRKPLPAFLSVLSYWPTFPIRKDLIKKWGTRWTDAGKLVTLGPYLLKARTGDQYLFVRNPKYRIAAAPEVPDSIEATVIEDEAKAKAAFFGGQFDFLLGAETADLLQAQNRPDYQAKFFDYYATFYLGFDQGDLQNKNLDFRKAIALTLDRATIPTILKGGQLAAKGWIPPGIEGHGYQLSSSFTTFEARAALARAKKAMNSDTVSIRLGSETFDGSAALQSWMCENFRTTLEIECTVVSGLENASIFVRHWGADFADPLNFFEVWTSSSNVKYLRWNSKAYDQEVFSLSTERDPQLRLKHMRNAENILTDREMAILPLFYAKTAAVLGPSVKSLDVSPMNYFFFNRIQSRESVAP